MTGEKSIPLDIAVVGGGPAGISACLELSKSSGLRIALFESEAELGGMPRSCHLGFGMRDRKVFYSGPAYTRKLNKLILKTRVEIHTEATVSRIDPGNSGELHRIRVLTKQGLKSYESRFIVLAMGCYEISHSARDIPSKRPEGIFTTGTLQQMVNLHHLKPGKRAIIIGSEHVALSSVLTLRRSGTAINGIVEEDSELQTYASVAGGMSLFYNFPIYKGTLVKAILGDKRVEGVELAKKGTEDSFQLECDTIIITGKFSPISLLIDNTPIEKDASTGGPVVDMNLMTSVPNILAAGNVLRGADMNDLCALEGKYAARIIQERFRSSKPASNECISIKAEPPIRYVVPQKIAPAQIRAPLFSGLSPGFTIQLEHTLKHPILEAWSGNEKIWEWRFSKLIANNRIPLPVQKFDWNRVGPQKEIVLKIVGTRHKSQR